MTEITFYTRKEVRDILTGQHQGVARLTSTTTFAMREISRLHQYSGHIVTQAVAQAKQMINEAGGLSADQQKQAAARTQHFLTTVLAIEDEAARRILALLQSQ